MRAPPDGYALLLVAAGNAINVTLFDKLNYNFIRDIVPVAGIIRAPNVMAVHPAVPVIVFWMFRRIAIKFATILKRGPLEDSTFSPSCVAVDRSRMMRLGSAEV